MSRSQAMRSAFATLFRDPTIFLSELVSRWVLVLTSLCLIFYGLIAYTHALEVTNEDMLGLSGLIPGTALAAIKHVFAGSGSLLVRETIAVAFGIGMMWWLVSTITRSVTASALGMSEKPRIAVVARANAVRLALATCLCIVDIGVFLVAAQRAHSVIEHTDRTPYLFIALPLWLLAGVAFSSVSWYLSLVPYSDQRTLRDSLMQVGAVSRRAGSQFLWIAVVLGVLRVAFYVMGFLFLMFTLGFILEAPPVFAWLLLGMIAFLYAMISSVIQLLRAAAYARVFTWVAEQENGCALAAMV